MDYKFYRKRPADWPACSVTKYDMRSGDQGVAGRGQMWFQLISGNRRMHEADARGGCTRRMHVLTPHRWNLKVIK